MFDHTNLPVEKKPKLVRDRIPEIIEQNEPVTVITKILDEEEYRASLVEKFHEETDELNLALKENTNITEELADILELINATAVLSNSSLEEIETIRKKKETIRGGFAKRIMLIEKKPKNEI